MITLGDHIPRGTNSPRIRKMMQRLTQKSFITKSYEFECRRTLILRFCSQNKIYNFIFFENISIFGNKRILKIASSFRKSHTPIFDQLDKFFHLELVLLAIKIFEGWKIYEWFQNFLRRVREINLILKEVLSHCKQICMKETSHLIYFSK